MEVSDSIILVVSPFNALMRDQSINLDSMQVPSVIIRNGVRQTSLCQKRKDEISEKIESFMDT